MEQNNRHSDSFFTVRTFGFGELAQLYFSNITPNSATKKFRRWINLNPRLKIKVPPQTRDLTPQMVKEIISEFDLPETYINEYH